MKVAMAHERPAVLPSDLSRALSSDFLLRVTMARRRSGGPRTVELTFARSGERAVVLSGYPGERDWVANIAANPEVVLHTVHGPRFYDIPAIARRVTERNERTPLLLAFLGRWGRRSGLMGPLLIASLWAIRLNRALRLPWWGPFYPMRRLMDRMPCLEARFVGDAVERPSPPATSERPAWG